MYYFLKQVISPRLFPPWIPPVISPSDFPRRFPSVIPHGELLSGQVKCREGLLGYY